MCHSIWYRPSHNQLAQHCKILYYITSIQCSALNWFVSLFFFFFFLIRLFLHIWILYLPHFFSILSFFSSSFLSISRQLAFYGGLSQSYNVAVSNICSLNQTIHFWLVIHWKSSNQALACTPLNSISVMCHIHFSETITMASTEYKTFLNSNHGNCFTICGKCKRPLAIIAINSILILILFSEYVCGAHRVISFNLNHAMCLVISVNGSCW